MFIKLTDRSEHHLTHIKPLKAGGFECSLEFPNGDNWNYEYSDITKKFYPAQHKKALPQYIQKALLGYASERKGYKL